MTTLELDAENVEATVAEHEIVLVDFWASWCGPRLERLITAVRELDVDKAVAAGAATQKRSA